MIDLRPISICNVVYKIMSKCLKPLLHHLISDQQSAFIPGRLITDFILVAYETPHCLIKNKTENNVTMAVKLDMSKAYDRVEWDFLEGVMRRMDFPMHWINLVMRCVTTVSFNVCVNAILVGPIVPNRGLRQGDPLSPYLFIICAGALTSLLRRSERIGDLNGIKVVVGAPSISCLLFTDDSLMFCNAKGSEAQKLKDVLVSYSNASRQVINFDKSSISFSPRVSENIR